MGTGGKAGDDGPLMRRGDKGSRPGGGGTWRLVREDDNGNRFPVAAFPTREEAEQARERYEARGHKQFYWIEAPPDAACS
jgi:hypothetical protein